MKQMLRVNIAKRTRFMAFPHEGKTKLYIPYSLFFVVTWKDGERTEHYINVPEGYIFAASIPWGVRWLIGGPNEPQFREAACAHDYMFEYRLFGFEIANEVFNRLLMIHGVPAWKRRLMRWAVKSPFGRLAWET